MTKLFVLLFAPLALASTTLARAAARVAARVAARRFTPAHAGTKPRADFWVESLFGFGFQMVAAVRNTVADVLAAVQGWTAWAVDPECPEPAIAPAMTAAIGAQAPVPATIASVGRAVGEHSRRIVDDVAVRFGNRWTEPEDARMAAGLFLGAIALSCAGLVGIVTVTSPEPAVHLQRLASAVNLADANAAASAPAATTTPSASPSSTEAPAPTEPPAAPPAEVPAASEAAAPVTPPAAAVAPVAVPPASRGGLPIGKGMWIWMEDRADGGDPNAIVSRAVATGLTHIYVRTGTLKGGFIGGPFLDRLLPVAHANGIRVYGWDFPYLNRPGDDVNRALAAIHHTTPDGHRIDGFSADIESSREGTNNSHEYVTAYCSWLRQNVGPDYPLIATVPNPTPAKVKSGFPYGAIVPHFDGVAPMVYWMNRDPASDVANAINFFASQWDKPVFPIGQAYDGGPEGGPPGVPDRAAIIRFMQFADAAGGSGVSFWSWQHATQDVWDAVRDAAEFRLEAGGIGGDGLRPGMIRAYETALTGLGFPVPADGVWDQATTDAVKAYQTAANLPVTSAVDAATRAFLLTPVAAPLAVH